MVTIIFQKKLKCKIVNGQQTTDEDKRHCHPSDSGELNEI